MYIIRVGIHVYVYVQLLLYTVIDMGVCMCMFMCMRMCVYDCYLRTSTVCATRPLFKTSSWVDVTRQSCAGHGWHARWGGWCPWPALPLLAGESQHDVQGIPRAAETSGSFVRSRRPCRDVRGPSRPTRSRGCLPAAASP